LERARLGLPQGPAEELRRPGRGAARGERVVVRGQRGGRRRGRERPQPGGAAWPRDLRSGERDARGRGGDRPPVGGELGEVLGLAVARAAQALAGEVVGLVAGRHGQEVAAEPGAGGDDLARRPHGVEVAEADREDDLPPRRPRERGEPVQLAARDRGPRPGGRRLPVLDPRGVGIHAVAADPEHARPERSQEVAEVPALGVPAQAADRRRLDRETQEARRDGRPGRGKIDGDDGRGGAAASEG
jgi:hypothetical protein